MEENKKEQCPEFPFFGARYPDARCINGELHDLDRCDENGNLYEMHDYCPCPFCNEEEATKQYSISQERLKKWKENILTKWG